MRPIVLTGMMGAGKTTIATEVGRVLRCPVVGLDEEVERRASRSVSEIFEEFGEEGFRRRELQAFQNLVESGFDILALGGGAFLTDPLRIGIESSHAVSVYLHAPVESLCRRLEVERSERPLLASPDWKDVLREMYAARDPIYRLADLVVETSGRSVSDVASEVIDVVSI